MDLLMNNIGMVAGLSGTGVVLWGLKRIPNAKIASSVEGLFFKLGRMLTMWLGSKKSPVGKFWNKTIEPWFIDLLDNLLVAGFKGLVKGLRIDG
tara:strand:+ start:444 stop:725 length:282 start_codon:yes stop_codon:yes gene_type:complete